MSVLSRLRHRRHAAPDLAGKRLLAAFADAYPAATFVEVGSNDGEQHDHLRPYILGRSWRGAMVEPVPYVFARLRHNYAGLGRVVLVNAAVGAQDGRATFYHLRDAPEGERRTLPDWYDGIGSMSREAVLSHAPQMPDIMQRLVEVDVEVLSFASVCARAGLDAVDLVVIDAEGHDWEIVRGIDLGAHAPRLLVYEHFHLDRGDQAAATAHLRAAGYEILEEGFDTFCLKPADDPLTRRFRELEPVVGPVFKDDEAG